MLIISNCELYGSSLYFSNISTSTRILNGINITCNTFDCLDDYTHIYLTADNKQMIVNIAENIFESRIINSKPLSLIHTSYVAATIIFKGNRISDIKSCLMYGENVNSTAIFNNNIFNRVSKLFHDHNISIVKLNRNNMFIDCGNELTKHVL